MRIGHKIVLSIYAVLLPTFLIVESIIYWNSHSAVISERTRQYKRAVSSIDENIGYLEQDMLEIATYLSINYEIQRVLMSDPEETAEDPLFWSNKTPVNVIKDILAVKTKIATVALYPENGLRPFTISRDRSVFAPNIANLRGLDIYKRAAAGNGVIVWSRVNSDDIGLFINNRSDKIVACSELYDLSKRRKLGFLSLGIDLEGYESICANAMPQNNEAVLIFDSDGSEMFRYGDVPDEAAAWLRERDPNVTDEPLEYEKYYIFSQRRETSGQTIFYLSRKSDWDAWTRSGFLITCLSALALLGGVWPLSSFASRIVTRPIMLLYASMNKFKSGDFNQQVHVEGNDEISELAETFNTMVSDIREQIDKNYVLALREKQSELNALQAQINPHFLYNALDALYWQATECCQERLADDILAMSELFRMLLSNGNSEVTVEQELKIVRHYLQIQKLRFDKKMNYSIEVENELLPYQIPKLIIQPFVENAIVHGMEKNGTWGRIRITGRIDGDFLSFTVEDSGIGMSNERIQEILKAKDDDRYAYQRVGHYAVRNVKERMNLRYGAAAELTIESELNIGTKVQIKLPLIVPCCREAAAKNKNLGCGLQGQPTWERNEAGL
ncbi:MAG: sensor histidine kinase [Oscillospiraceae bacterium]|jgi:two-component system sensor histidine kinase YesM|nr:sensor histidine kinase [Oscillospiraceae bacterium]